MFNPRTNLSELWRRLGLRAQTDRNPPPAITPTVQPVLVVGDASRVGNYFDVPCSGFGWQVGGQPGGKISGGELRTNSPGGVWVEWFYVNNLGGAAGTNDNRFVWFVGTPHVPNFTPNFSTVEGNQLHRPVQATAAGSYVFTGSYIASLLQGSDMPVTAGAADVHAASTLGSQIQPNRVGPLWIPPGQSLLVESFTVGNGCGVNGWFWELPAGEQY